MVKERERKLNLVDLKAPLKMPRYSELTKQSLINIINSARPISLLCRQLAVILRQKTCSMTQKRGPDPVKHLWWCFLAEIANRTVNYSRKNAPSQTFGRLLNTPLKIYTKKQYMKEVFNNGPSKICGRQPWKKN